MRLIIKVMQSNVNFSEKTRNTYNAGTSSLDVLSATEYVYLSNILKYFYTVVFSKHHRNEFHQSGGIAFMCRKHLVWFLLLQLVFVLGGCGGGDDSTPPSQPQLSVQSVEVLTDRAIEPKSTVALSVTLSSDRDLSDLGISYYLISGDEATDRIESYYFGGAVIPLVASGENTYAQFFVFSGDAPAGTYNLLAYVDPMKTVFSSDIVYSAPDDVTVKIGADQGKPDLVLHDVRTDSSYLVLLQDDEPDDGVLRDNISATIDVESVAHGSANVAVMAYVETSAGYEQVRIWDSSAGTFAATHTIPSLGTNTVQSVMLDLLVPKDILARLAGKTTSNVKIVVDPLDAVEENENLMVPDDRANDNELVEPVNIFAGTPVAPKGDDGVTFGTSFSKGFDNRFFGAKVDFQGKAWFNKSGIGTYVSGAAPVTVLGNTFNFLGITSNARYNPILPTDAAFDLDVEFAGVTVYSKHGGAGFSWEQSWQVEKSKGFEQRMIIAIVPVKVSAGASGALGFRTSVNVDSKFDGTVSPFVDVGTYVTAGVDIVLASAGVRGNLHLLKFDFNTKLGGTIAADAGATQLTGTLDGTIGYTLTGPNGNIALFVRYPGICWKKILFINVPYPCCCPNEKELSLASFSSYSKTDTLLDKHQSAAVPLK